MFVYKKADNLHFRGEAGGEKELAELNKVVMRSPAILEKKRLNGIFPKCNPLLVQKGGACRGKRNDNLEVHREEFSVAKCRK